MNQEFRKYIHNKEVTPPDDVWIAIENRLDNKSKKRKFIYWPFLVAFAAVSIAIASYVFYENRDANPSANNEAIEKIENHSNSNSAEFGNVDETNYTLSDSSTTVNDNQIQRNTIARQADFQNNMKVDSEAKKVRRISNQSSPEIESNDIDKNETVTASIASSNLNEEELIFISNSDLNTNNESDIVDLNEIENENSIANANEDLKVKDDDLNSSELMDNDTLAIALNLEDSIGIDYKSKAKKKIKWEVSTYISPSYTRSASNDNIWLTDLYEYKGKYETAVNYGLDVQYNINDKWSLRSGIESTTLKQLAYDVNITTQEINHTGETDINYDGEEVSILRPDDFYNNYIYLSQLKNANVHQSISYIGIPLEFGYSLYNSKIIQMNAYLGSTTYFLQNNSIYFTDNDEKKEIGSAKNLNKLVIGTQFGLQTRFKFTNKIGFIFEPKFFYYFNTFNGDNKVRPYTINLNTGLTFGF